jgi:hypothetical protein
MNTAIPFPLRFTGYKSVNGNAARTISPGNGMAGEIRVVVAGLDVRVGIEIRFSLQEIQSTAVLSQAGDVCCSQIVFAVGRFLKDEDSEASVGGQRSFGRKAEPTPLFDFDWDCSPGGKMARTPRLPSPISGHCLSTPNSNSRQPQ